MNRKLLTTALLVSVIVLAANVPSQAIDVETTTTSVTTTVTTQMTHSVSADINISQLTYNFDSETVMVALEYTNPETGACITKGWARIIPSGDDYRVLVFRANVGEVKVSIVPREVLDADGMDLAEGRQTVERISQVLGALVAAMPETDD